MELTRKSGCILVPFSSRQFAAPNSLLDVFASRNRCIPGSDFDQSEGQIRRCHKFEPSSLALAENHFFLFKARISREDKNPLYRPLSSPEENIL